MFRSLAARPPRQLDPPPHFGATGLHVHPQYRHGARLHRRWMGRPVPSLRCFSSTSLGCRSNCALLASDTPPFAPFDRYPSCSNCPLATAPSARLLFVTRSRCTRQFVREARGHRRWGPAPLRRLSPLQAAVDHPRALPPALLHVLARGGGELHCPGHCSHIHHVALFVRPYRQPDTSVLSLSFDVPRRPNSALTSIDAYSLRLSLRGNATPRLPSPLTNRQLR